MMKSFLIVTCCALTVAGCSVDRGGLIDNFSTEIAQEPPVADATGKLWRPLQGDCESRCGMKLELQNVCTHYVNEFWVHAAYNPDGSINALGTAIMRKAYGAFPKFQARVDRDGALKTTQLTKYSGVTLHSYGVPYCPPGVRATSDNQKVL